MPYGQKPGHPHHTVRATMPRRTVLAGTATVACCIGLATSRSEVAAEAVVRPPVSEFDLALKKIMGDAKPAEGKLAFDIPEIAENGNTVPYTLAAESPMTATNFVKAFHVLATSNPQPGVASFAFTPDAGVAFVASRMRLARSQDVVAVAELSDGRFLLGRRSVKVTIGGCGG